MHLIPFLWFLFFPFDGTGPQIHGVSLVSPPKPISQSVLSSVTETRANWMTIIPYSFMRSGEATIQVNNRWQWWGESPVGTKELIRMAKSAGLKVLVKPHVWIGRGEFTGDIDFKTEEEWLEWEQTYKDYILLHASLAESLHVEMFCIGNELKNPVLERTPFFQSLIRSVRRVFSGSVTYGANWDEFAQVPFWDMVDFIGINAYFPLHPAQTPHPESLAVAWNPIVKELKGLSVKSGKPVLFTEFGYRSINQAAWRNWELDQLPRDQRKVNLEAQAIAYESFFKTFWNRSWVAGGFFWKWYAEQPAGGNANTDWTPQGKPAIEVIRRYYQQPAGHKN